MHVAEYDLSTVSMCGNVWGTVLIMAYGILKHCVFVKKELYKCKRIADYDFARDGRAAYGAARCKLEAVSLRGLWPRHEGTLLSSPTCDALLGTYPFIRPRTRNCHAMLFVLVEISREASSLTLLSCGRGV